MDAGTIKMKFPPEKTSASSTFLTAQDRLGKKRGQGRAGEIETSKLGTKDAQIIFRTTLDNKESLKSFFADRGLTLSKGVQLACFYLEQQIKSGDVEVCPSGLLAKKGGR